MFFEQITTEWGEILYMPTGKGEALFTAMIAFLLLVAMLFIQIGGQEATTRKLVCCVVTIGLATIFANIQLYALPSGGNITLLSMLVIALPGYWYGVGTGVAIGVAYGIFQMLIDPYMVSFSQIIVDYFLAFGAIGLSGLFSNHRFGLILGYWTGILGRYLFAVISGAVFFGAYAWEGWSPITYSVVYNAMYIFAEGVLTTVILMLPFVHQGMTKLKGVATKYGR